MLSANSEVFPSASVAVALISVPRSTAGKKAAIRPCGVGLTLPHDWRNPGLVRIRLARGGLGFECRSEERCIAPWQPSHGSEPPLLEIARIDPRQSSGSAFTWRLDDANDQSECLDYRLRWKPMDLDVDPLLDLAQIVDVLNDRA